ncbi:hypothetical protein I7I50_11818 [Histoplasma capsulatum G186AR]|uniref:Uncharacterized protein n=1 Tax=Ajellomyces capsulatus TaxID=5037 RepID=A0A8H8D9J6_AJECA|nr:hypothetical protein I7I52_03056 [Histoplasma capsulatum]QSS70251.1 hypothetical protein I7I50_11818 [Histoplasma capsulatum G186AR]
MGGGFVTKLFLERLSQKWGFSEFNTCHCRVIPGQRKTGGCHEGTLILRRRIRRRQVHHIFMVCLQKLEQRRSSHRRKYEDSTHAETSSWNQ